MELTIEQIKKMSSNEIINRMKSFFKSLYKNFDYLKITYDEYMEIVYRVIEESKTKYDNSKPYSLYLEENIQSKLITTIKDDNIKSSDDEIYEDIDTIDIYSTETIEEIEKDLSSDELDIVQMYLSETRRYPLLTAEEERNLIIRVKNGDLEARDLFLKSNLRLVISIAKKYRNMGLDFLDLIQEGNLGLILALEKYDINKPYRFSTPATYWIRREIRESLAKIGRTIRIPMHMFNEQILLKRIENELTIKLGRIPTIDELTKSTGFSTEKIKELYLLDNSIVSTNALINSEDDSELGDFIPDTNSTLEEHYIDIELKNQIRELFKNCNLTDREIEVLMLQYGFNDRRPMRLSNIGKIYGITRERTRQISVSAINKIRKSEYVKKIADYAESPDHALTNIEIFRIEAHEARLNGDRIYSLNRNSDNRRGIDTKKNLRAYGVKRKDLYSYFDKTKEEVDIAIEKLDESDKIIIESYKNGEPFNMKMRSKLNAVIYRINKLIDNPSYKVKRLSNNPKDGK